MIIDLFPKAGGKTIKMKMQPYRKQDSFPVRRHSSDTETSDSIEINNWKPQIIAAGTSGVVYLVGRGYYYNHPLVKASYNPITGFTHEWTIDEFDAEFDTIVATPDNCVYVTKNNGTLWKYSPDGESLWNIAESGVMCIGDNGNLFVWNSTYIKEYDASGSLLNKWDYTCDGIPIRFRVNDNNEFFIVTSTQLARLTPALEVVWTYAATFGTGSFSYTNCAIDIDKSCNFYMYTGDGDSGVKCISADGELLWDSGELDWTSIYICIFVDNFGAVYLCNYHGNLFKLDAKTGTLISNTRFYEHTGHKVGCADMAGNIYVWCDWKLCSFFNYLGTVSWTENDKSQERFIIQELEHGDGYMILLDDEEVAIL